MAISRRILLSYGIATAIACAPHTAMGVGRILPRDTGGTNRGGGPQGNSPNVGANAPQNTDGRYARTATITRDSFQSVLGSAFKVSSTSGKGQPFWLRLLSVRDIEAAVPADPASMAVPPPPAALHPLRTEMFSLGFSGGPVRNLEQETFFFQHEELGQFALFIVPAAPQQYTAVVNRLPVRTVIGV
jgi:hypothetical protein